MGMTDPIADMLTRIRNANQNRSETVLIPASKIKLQILKVIKEEGFINEFEFKEDDKQGMINVTLKYTSKKERIIKGITRISKPGLRVYVQAEKLPKVLNGLGTAIISTSNGVMTDREARHQNLGGEVIAYIW